MRSRLITVGVVAIGLLPAAAHAGTPAAVFAANFTDESVSQYSLAADGLLSADTPATAKADNGAAAIVVSPDASSVYVANENADDLSQYTITPAGLLAPKSPATVPTCHIPDGVAISPDGSSLYVSCFGADQVEEYNVGAGGTLAPKSSPTVTLSAGPEAIALTPDGHSAYVTTTSPGKLYQYDVGAGGELSAKTPASLPITLAGYGIAVSPDGRSLYVAGGQAPGYVAQFDIMSDGTLAPKVPATVAAGSVPYTVQVSRDGTSVYVVDHSNDKLLEYTIGAGGRLTAKAPASIATGGMPNDLLVLGASAFVSNETDGTISQYTVGAGGTLSPAVPATVPTQRAPNGIAVVPDGGPQASFAPQVQAAGSPTIFTGSPGPAYTWSFGDGSTAHAITATTTHLDTHPGVYTVTMTATDAFGCSLAYVYSGESTSCLADPAAASSHLITVPAPSNRFAISSTSVGRGGVIALELAAHAPGSWSAQAITTVTLKRVRGHRPHRRTRTIHEKLRYGHASASTLANFSATLRIAPPGRTWRAVKAGGHRIKVSIAVTFTPTDGTPATVRTTVGVKPR